MKKIKFTKKKIIIAIVMLVVIFAIFKINSKSQPLLEVETVQIERGNVQKTLDVKGLVKSKDSAEITSPFSYKVTQILVSEGDLVTTNQILATLETDSIEDEIAILSKQIQLDEMRNNTSFQGSDRNYSVNETMQLALDSANLAYEESLRQESIKEELFKNGAISREELNHAKLARENAYTQVENAKVALEKSNHDMNIAKESTNLSKMQLDQKIQTLEDLKIKSPIDGVVTRVYARIGRTARDTEENKPMFIVEDISEKYLKVDIGEYNIDEINIGQDVLITAEVLGEDSIKGQINSISPTGEEESHGSTNRVVPVTIKIGEDDGRLLSGVSAKAQILIDEEKNALYVPFDAIGYDKDGAYIYEVKGDSTLHKIQVQVGLESNLTSQIISEELEEGMNVVLSPSENMTDGMKITVKTSEEDSSAENPAANVTVETNTPTSSKEEEAK